MAKDKDTSLMVGGKSVPVEGGVAKPQPEKLTPKEVLEQLEDHDNRIDALEEMAFGDVKEKLEEMLKGAAGNINARLDALDAAVFEEETKP